MRNFWNKIKLFFKKIWRWILGLFVVSAIAIALPPQGADPVNLSTVPGYFAEVDASGNVLRVIVISPADLATGQWGDPDNWIETKKDGSIRKNYAGVGSKYDKNKDVFIYPKQFNSWVLDEETARYKPPVDYPNDGHNYKWDEKDVNWKRI